MVPSRLVAALRRARRVAVLTGSGISAESGVPTFRDAQTGLWAKFSPEDLATPQAFARDPLLVWRWYRWRRGLVAQARPNAGHEALRELAGLVNAFTLITQNVDGLHQRAGSTDVIEFHGNILRDRCSRSCSPAVPAPEVTGEESFARCPACDSLMRPDVVWFGEAIPQSALQRAQAAASECEVFLSIGTSSLVYPAAGLASQAKQAGAMLVEVNPNPTPMTAAADVAMREPAATALPAILAALRA